MTLCDMRGIPTAYGVPLSRHSFVYGCGMARSAIEVIPHHSPLSSRAPSGPSWIGRAGQQARLALPQADPLPIRQPKEHRVHKSAFVEWQDPPPVKRSGGSRRGGEYFDSAALVIDLMKEPGRWALTHYRGESGGLKIVRWCDNRGIRAEHAYRDGQVFIRVRA